MGSWTDWFTGKGSGLTDAEYAAQRKAKAEADKKQQDAVLARRAADAKVRVAANTPTQEEKDFRRARNTRVDQLTPEQRRLIQQGRADTPGETRDRWLAEKFPLDKALTGLETDKKNPRSKAASSSAPKVEYPKPSTEKQPQLELNPDQGSRTTTIGSSSTQVFDINSFRAEIIENDVLPSHSYLVTFAQFRSGVGPEVGPLNDFVINKRNTLMMRCENVVLPTPSLLEEENIRRYGYGPVEKVPYGVQFSDVSITWLVDKNSEIIDFMHQWMNTIVMHDSPNTLMSPNFARTGLEAYAPFEVGYKDAYANPIVRIQVYNRQQQTVTKYEMYDVFPMNIQSINLGWADENQVQKLTVTFAYTNMKVEAPLKVKAGQENYYLQGRSNPYEEKEQPDNKGGKAAADRKDSPVKESNRKTANSSNPTIKSGSAKPTAGSATSQPIVRSIAT